MNEIRHLLTHLPDGLIALGILILGILAGLLFKYIIGRTLLTLNGQRERTLVDSAMRHYHRPASFFFPLLVVSFLLPLVEVDLPGNLFYFIRRLLEISLLVAFAWMLINTVYLAEDYVRSRLVITKSDNIRERRVLTQLQFIKRLTIIFILFLTVAFVLMSFATVRKIGTGLITSAGIASVIIGFAAQRSIANLLAGLQLAFTQPMRIDDVLIVEGEYGRVEEITFTYVVLGLWDQRRLVVPLNYFIEKPFQNWTRSTSQLLGTIFIYSDYTLPVEAVRAELKRLVAQHPLWDKRVCVLHVTDSKEKTLELRALVSTADSSTNFDLRCDIREGLVTFIQKNYPGCLPKTRSVLEPGPLTVAPFPAVPES